MGVIWVLRTWQISRALLGRISLEYPQLNFVFWWLQVDMSFQSLPVWAEVSQSVFWSKSPFASSLALSDCSNWLHTLLDGEASLQRRGSQGLLGLVRKCVALLLVRMWVWWVGCKVLSWVSYFLVIGRCSVVMGEGWSQTVSRSRYFGCDVKSRTPLLCSRDKALPMLPCYGSTLSPLTSVSTLVWSLI